MGIRDRFLLGFSAYFRVRAVSFGECIHVSFLGSAFFKDFWADLQAPDTLDALNNLGSAWKAGESINSFFFGGGWGFCGYKVLYLEDHPS